LKRVIIVAEGQWGQLKPEDYQPQIEMFRRVLEEAEEPYGSEGRQVGTRKTIQVQVAKTVAEAEMMIKDAAIDTRPEVVIFISRGMEAIAERFAAIYPKIKIIVLTGLIPEGKVIWVHKGWLLGSKFLQNIVLRG
jgi:hypothetical protein